MNAPKRQPLLVFLVETIAIAAVYFLAAELGFLFSISPGNVTLLWLPSGLAVAGAFLIGYRAGPGIWLGSFLANLWQAGGGAWMAAPTALLVSAAIATGSTLQALVAWRILLRRVAPDLRKIAVTGVLVRNLIVATALACLVAATVGVAALFLSGQVAVDALAFTWGVWWLGDWVGMLAGTPLFYWAGVFLLRRSSPNVDPILVTGVGILISVALFTLSWTQETRAINTEFIAEAGDAQTALVQTLDDAIHDLDALKSFFMASASVSRDDFERFTQGQLSGRHATPGLQGLSWNPYVQYADRAAVEALVRQEGFPEFQFTERTAAGQLVRAADRADYVIVNYIEPLQANMAALGFDVSSNPIRREALTRARDTGLEVMTAPVLLVQDIGKHVGFLVFAPVYQKNAIVATAEERRANLRGFVVSVIRIDMLVEASLTVLPVRGREIYLFDMDMPEGQQLLVYHPSRMRTEPAPVVDPTLRPAALYNDFYYARTIEMAGRHWQIVIKPAPGVIAAKRSWTPWIVLGFSFLVTASTAAYFLNRQAAGRQMLDLFESMPDGVVATDAEGRIVLVNARAEQLFGYARAELLGQPVEMLLPTQSYRLHMEHRRRYLASPGMLLMNERINIYGLRKDGSQFPADISLNAVTSQNGLMVIAVARDITQKMKTEKALEDAERQYRLLFEEAPVMNILIELRNDAYVITKVNQVWLDALGYAETETIGRSLADFYTPASQEALKHTRDSLKTGDFVMAERELVARDGHVIPTLVRAIGRLDEQGQLIGTQAAYVDISERKRLEEAVRRSQEELLQKSYENLKRVLDASADAMLIIDDRHIVKFANRAARSLFGQKIAEGEQVGAFLHTDETGELDILQPDGTLRIAEARSAQTDWFGQEAQIVVFRDVTDRRQLAEFWRSASFRDELTGLYNRRGFLALARKQLELARRNNTPATLLFGDLDGLKPINDIQGHQVGDQALISIATIFREVFRDSDVIARLGGDEFAIFLTDTGREKFARLQRRLQERIDTFNRQGAQTFVLSISTGAVFSETDPTQALEEMLAQADALQYERKRERRR